MAPPLSSPAETNRPYHWLVFGPQPIPAGVNETTTLIMTQFKFRIGVLPIFSDEELHA
jgi:hypothetical protein